MSTTETHADHHHADHHHADHDHADHHHAEHDHADHSEAAAKSIPRSPFEGDDGLADPELLAALVGVEAGDVPYEVANRMRRARLFVPVMEVVKAPEEKTGGHCGDRDTQMAIASVTGADGRRAALAFTSVESLSKWSPEARPYAAYGMGIAASALDEGAVAVIVDAGSEHMQVIGIAGLFAIIEDRDWVPPVRDEQVLSAIGTALTPLAERYGTRFEVEPGTGGQDLRIILRPASADQSGVSVQDQLAGTAEALGAVELLRTRLPGGVALSVGALL